ncbi:MAG: branched-chain amino acid ABC transporter permease [Actinobacteria bacterium]|jgi:branched-chain amino acid transport system permease protein|nr:branched-chain amino acid ABC transporter permease [Actinomycetota bacterium]
MRLFSTLLIGLSSGAIYSLMALALVLVWRSTRVVNFAQAGQAIASTYIGYLVISRTDNYWLALPVALVAGALIGALVDVALIRTLNKRVKSGPAAEMAPVIVTLGLLGLIRSTVGMIWGGDLKAYKAPVTNHGFTFGTTTIPFSPYNLLIVITAVIVMAVFSIIFQKTNLGLSLRAAAFQPEIARLAGVRVDLVRTIGWAFAGGAGAVAGVLVTPSNSLSPNSLDLLLVLGFVGAVIGGLESLLGAAIGGVVLGIGLAFILEYVSTSLAFPSAFIVLILVLLIKPSGILGKKGGRGA